MYKPVDTSCLFKTTSVKDVEIGGHTYRVGSSGSTGKSLYPGPRSSRTTTAKYSNSLFVWKAWVENNLFVAMDRSKTTIYLEYKDVYSEAAIQKKSALAVLNGATNEWEIQIGNHSSPRTVAGYISIIAAACAYLFEPEYNRDPLLFCDSVYFGYIYDHKNGFTVSDSPDSTIEDQAKRACESGLLLTVVGTSPFASDKAPTPTPASEVCYDFKPFLSGDKKIPYKWDKESETKIVGLPFLEDFVPTKAFFSLAQKLTFRLGKVIERLDSGLTGKEAIGRDYLNIRLVGNPGSGKTVLGTALSAALGLPLYTIPIQKHTEEDTFEGKNKMVKGKLSFVQTDFLQAYKNGGIVVLEEINLADPALIMGALGQAIEPPFVLNENGFQTVTRHPMCVIIATQNVGTVGSKAVNQALTSRFPHTYIINDPTEDEFVDRLSTRYSDKKTCKWVYKSYTKIKKHLCSAEVSAEDIALALTFRACLGVLEDIEEGLPRKEALEKFRAIIYGESPDIAEIISEVINSLPGV